MSLITVFITITVGLFYLYLLLATLYIFIFAVASKFEGATDVGKATAREVEILVLIPAYREDKVIFRSVESLMEQKYSKEQFKVVVISDQMAPESNSKLRKYPIELLVIEPEKSSKALALNAAMEWIEEANELGGEFDLVVILDADNIVESTFLKELSIAYGSGLKAIQAHRTASNLEGAVAILDAISEEINNSIYRKGHVNLKLPSALIGSGMAFDFKWFKENYFKLETVTEDKELELLLLKDRLFVGYLEECRVLDEKVKESGTFYNQRRRWQASQFLALKLAMTEFVEAVKERNWPYLNKVIQWLLPPHAILLLLLFFATLISACFSVGSSLPWLLLLSIVVISFWIATPKELRNKESLKALLTLPELLILMVLNYFRMRGANTQFIHTKKG